MLRSLIFLLCAFTLACSKESAQQKVKIAIPVVHFEQTDLSGKVFFIGPEIDSVNARIVADCDCCASDLAFVDSTSFIYIERCLGGDVYVKGHYLTLGSLLFLRTDKDYVSSEDSMVPDTISYTTYELGYSKPNYVSYVLSELKGEQFITYSKDDYTEYGIATDISITHFLKEFKDEKVLKDFLKSL